jgi:hypothetical protein
MSKKFQRNIENFTCENCEEEVKGNGYTNHCPKCFYSKHVDNNPGDRENSCQGLMEPIHAYFEGGEWIIIQKCQKCEEERKIKSVKEDDLNMILKISTNSIKD